MSSFRFLRPLLNTARAQPIARIAYKNAFTRPVMKKTFLQPTIIASQRAFTVGAPRFSSGDGKMNVLYFVLSSY